MKLTDCKSDIVAEGAADGPDVLTQSQRLLKAHGLIDPANAMDPAGLAALYGRRMAEAKRIAARAQHIERWTIARGSYPEGRSAYLTWRKKLQKLHARRAAMTKRACLPPASHPDLIRVSLFRMCRRRCPDQVRA